MNVEPTFESEPDAHPPSPVSTLHALRPLYRGALNLPDSHLLLDGLTFTTIPTRAPIKLLENPLALALESMRGRPSLRFLHTTKLKDVRLDCSGCVTMSIHPHATLSHIYFENVFCLSPMSEDGRSVHGVQVALGDAEGPETTNILIFAQLMSNPQTGSPYSPPRITLQVGRIITVPPSPTDPRTRVPRPDDPTPRVPPPFYGTLNQRSSEIQGTLTRNRRTRKDPVDDDSIRRARDVMLNMPRSASGDAQSITSMGAKDTFKIPQLPRPSNPLSLDGVEHELEKANKLIIKSSTVRSLSSYKISKDHPEFKDLFGFVYRGATFALRTKLKVGAIDLKTVDRVVDVHVRMYVACER